MTTNTNITKITDFEPSVMIAHFRELMAAGEINPYESRMALKRWVTKGNPFIVRQGVRYTWTVDSIGCDCGKGVLCPAVKQNSQAIK